MKRGSTLFLKAAVFLIGIPVLVLCVVGLPWLLNNPVNPEFAHMLYPIVTILYVSVIPFCMGLFQAIRLLSYIDKNKAFSIISVKALKMIKICAFSISILYVIMLPFIFLLAEKDDAPGLIIIGMVLIFAPLVVAVFAAVLQKLMQEAIEIKSENDLII
ncbi:DUF2975 domain-containing protein [Paenibacillus urinalis]|uniref:DUF2975 domain-containing protein n=1 Tax=Paenibacillus urinalis TaxID=521520 RepID=A0AAX3MWI6_9BACL|nr:MULTISPECIES: DUF2975 domain-containing protein [Paenibacillus]WDH80805.1 DUF2975 domain-containing protein [Paenibacillus urinalis]WDH96859.1 DUF2975 domain-containing protein [Paenibacillus urinalis]WDI00500.1 DUF2975 domain-containing protein [Paenibacillus urinalis]GAK39174.1 hypothetical protein TCA2_1662 [Paenibacillus sp. TCA20]